MKIKGIYVILIAFATLTACRKERNYVYTGADSDLMIISVKADEPISPEFSFIFWNKSDFETGLSSAASVPVPYHVSMPFGEIDDYQVDKYNTGRNYPDNYGVAVCTGYYPFGLQVGGTDDMPDYRELSLAEGMVSGETDVMVSRNFIEGSSIYPFYGTIEFSHVQIKLAVRAKLAPTMAKYIKGLAVKIDGVNLLQSLVWNDDDGTWVISSERSSDGYILEMPATEYLNQIEGKPVEEDEWIVLIVPEPGETSLTNIKLSVSGLIANTQSEDGTSFNSEIEVDLTPEKGDAALMAGDSYRLLLIFDEDQVEIEAVRLPWKDGGNILIPVQPLPL